MLVSAPARGNGLVAAAGDLAAEARAELQAEIAAYQLQDPQAFAALQDLRGYRPEHYLQFRNPVPTVSLELRRLGAKMLLPMLDALILRAPDLHGASEVERRALIEGMIGEVGRLRDPRAAGVLHAVFAKPPLYSAGSSWLIVATGQAMGRLCDATSLDKLRLGLSDPLRRAAGIAGLGECRSLGAAKILAGELDAVLAPEEAMTIAEALGTLGSSWAWEAMGDTRKAEGMQVRELIAGALVRGFLRTGDEARDAHRRGLSMVDHPETRRIAAANGGGGDASARSDLDSVVRAIEKRQKP